MAEERAVKDGADGRRNRPAGKTDDATGVDALRRRIDDLDEQLVQLLSARAACALEVGVAKKRLGLNLYQPSREADVLAHVQQINPGPLDDAAIKRLFERIIDEARRLEREAEVKKTNQQSDEHISKE